MIAIIDYGMGNLASVEKALRFLGLNPKITRDHNDILKSRGIILPGVGSFEQGMTNLKEFNLDQVLTTEVIKNKKPFLGICLGMQLILEFGHEPKLTKGLGWIKGTVEPIETIKSPVPHLGWNNVYQSKHKKSLDELKNNYYFIHSYHVLPSEELNIEWVDYEFPIVAAFKKDNIHATQFHPEKSQMAGLAYLKNIFY